VTTARIVAARQAALMCTAVYTADSMVTKADASLPPPPTARAARSVHPFLHDSLVGAANKHTHTARCVTTV